MTAFGLVQGIVTLSANDFMDFLLSYIVGFGFLVLERMYVAPCQSDCIDWIVEKISYISNKACHNVKKKLSKAINSFLDETIMVDDKFVDTNALAKEPSGETVEPIIDSYGSYCLDTLSLLYVPYVILLLMFFRDDTAMTTLYGIKEKDMEHYAVFAFVIIPFQFAADIFLHSSLELYYGWKIHDYLIYTRYRFLQREARWKGLEDSLDECIDEGVRTMDHMCFSSQFYMMTTIHVNGIIYFVLGIEMMARAKYNMFGDPAMPILILFVVSSSIIVKYFLVWAGSFFDIWQIRQENTAWHATIRDEENIQLPDWDEINDNHDVYEMNKRLSSETFRHKFLDHNRSWLIDKLPSILTPRTLRRNRPYLINQLSKVLGSLNADISSDSDDEDEEPKFDIDPRMNKSTRSMFKEWVRQAKRRIKMRESVQSYIQEARGNYCERCLSRKLLHVKMNFSIEEMYVILTFNLFLLTFYIAAHTVY
eukprot:CAMPEP_0184861788 /NCGR_PEP_ID=MMETSP0580-20130426/6397_1 /TAXON_ID=1118495 /ORGANISM="Dactyliosolen fragilissimus" /LENGTH=478 /DNA_ID=CAMNT_0027359417 /DNA_START=725 /DNA_END=2161 /DNA_ORIENTATION=+